MLVILSYRNLIKENSKAADIIALEHIAYTLLICFLYIAFGSKQILSFFIAFEATLLPLYSIIRVLGTRKRRFRAALSLLVYTLIGSITLLLSIFNLFHFINNININIITGLTESGQILLLTCLGFFISFAIKIPIIPFHA
jgi:NADH:ubiquinone oxidoreductase subunit 4 (subunit M)